MPSRGRNRAKPSGNQLNRCRLVRQRRSRVALRSSLRAALMKPHLKQWPEMFSSLPWVILVFVGNNFIFQETTLFFVYKWTEGRAGTVPLHPDLGVLGI